jgi:hypothetical protein
VTFATLRLLDLLARNVEGFAVEDGPGASVPVVAPRHRSLAGNVMPTALSCFFSLN